MTEVLFSPTEAISEQVQNRVTKWKKKFASLTDILLPTDYPRPLPHRMIEAERSIELEDSICLAILRIALQLSSEIQLKQEVCFNCLTIDSSYAIYDRLGCLRRPYSQVHGRGGHHCVQFYSSM